MWRLLIRYMFYFSLFLGVNFFFRFIYRVVCLEEKKNGLLYLLLFRWSSFFSVFFIFLFYFLVWYGPVLLVLGVAMA